MNKFLLNLARGNSLLGLLYRVYLHIKRFVLYHLGFYIATSYSKDKKIIQCMRVDQETFDFFVEKKK